MEWRIGLLILESVSDSAFFASKVGKWKGEVLILLGENTAGS